MDDPTFVRGIEAAGALLSKLGMTFIGGKGEYNVLTQPMDGEDVVRVVRVSVTERSKRDTRIPIQKGAALEAAREFAPAYQGNVYVDGLLTLIAGEVTLVRYQRDVFVIEPENQENITNG